MARRTTAEWVGIALSALVVLVLAADAAATFSGMTDGQMEATGLPVELGPLLGGIMVVCVALYAIPSTSVIGAILMTGFLGGAICTHFRLGEVGSPPQLISFLLGVIAWGGLYLRDTRLKALLPLRRADNP